MFKYAETIPPVYPNRTAVMQGTVGPVVWCETVAGNADLMVAFNGVEFWECVKTGLPLLAEARRSELIRLLGGVTRNDHQVTIDALADAQAYADSVVERVTDALAADVIDLDAERAIRRPEPASAA